MTNASHLFRRRDQLEKVEGAYLVDGNTFRDRTGALWLPLYEGKVVTLFNHRYAGVRTNLKNVSGQGIAVHSSVSDLADPDFRPLPRYWVQEPNVSYSQPYALAFNDV